MEKGITNVCVCAHAEEMHKGPWLIQDGQPPRSNKDASCSATNCPCKEYQFKQTICSYCTQEIKNDGPYAKKITDENPAGGSQDGFDYCLTEGCSNFKHQKS